MDVQPSLQRAGESSLGAVLEGTPYRAVRLIGRGGVGSVYEAEHAALGKPVVVKVLRDELAQRPDLVERMRVEAQALARLAHPNLVAVTDYGRTRAGRTFIVMERLRGRTLREELDARGALPLREAITLATHALAGLAAAHDAGLVHRDVKPANLFVCDPGTAGATLKVLDFGIAKQFDPNGAVQRIGLAPLEVATAAGAWVGTPGYAAPEQLLLAPVAPATDVYAVGLVLYEMVAGRHAFASAPDVRALCQAQLHQMPPPPSRIAPTPVPAWFDHLVLRALAKAPADRFPSARAFADALLAAAQGLDAPSPRAAPHAATPAHLDARGAAMDAPTETHHGAASSPGIPATVARTPIPQTVARPTLPSTVAHPSPAAVLPATHAAVAPAPARAQRLAVASLVLALASLLWRTNALLHAVRAIADPTQYFAPVFGTAPPHAVSEQIADLCARIVPAAIARNAALGASSAALVFVGARLWRDGARAARPVHAWTSWAFAAVALSLVVDLAVTLPVQYEYQRLALPYVATSHNEALAELLTPATLSALGIAVVLLAPLGQLVWPVVLRVWAARALRQPA